AVTPRRRGAHRSPSAGLVGRRAVRLRAVVGVREVPRPRPPLAPPAPGPSGAVWGLGGAGSRTTPSGGGSSRSSATPTATSTTCAWPLGLGGDGECFGFYIAAVVLLPLTIEVWTTGD